MMMITTASMIILIEFEIMAIAAFFAFIFFRSEIKFFHYCVYYILHHTAKISFCIKKIMNIRLIKNIIILFFQLIYPVINIPVIRHMLYHKIIHSQLIHTILQIAVLRYYVFHAFIISVFRR